MMDVSTVETLARLAQQFGPFLFAILFIVFVTRTAHGYYRESATRTNPGASAEEKRAYRFYFICSIWAGLAVMMLAIGWWFYVNWRGNNVYQVAILNLQDDEVISADYFTKKVQRPPVVGGSPIHDEYLLIVRDEPFEIGEKFAFSYYKFGPMPVSGLGRIDPVPLEIAYSGKSKENFRMGLENGVPTLVAVDTGEVHPRILMGTVTQGPPSPRRVDGDP
jgi:hypothetical protein